MYREVFIVSFLLHKKGGYEYTHTVVSCKPNANSMFSYGAAKEQNRGEQVWK